MENIDDEEYALDDAMQDLAAGLEFMYFDHMLCVRNAKFKDFRKDSVEMTKLFCDKIHDRYCDHVESIKKEKLARMGLRGE